MVGDRPDNLPEKQTPHGGFWQDDLLKPLYNEAVAGPLNALRTVANPVVHAITGNDLERAPVLAVNEETTLSPAWFVQKVAGGVGSLIPYLAAARVTGGVLRNFGAAAGLDSVAAKLATSERFALVSGAGAYDFLRDDNPNGTSLRERVGNSLGGASAFYVFGVGNALTAEAGLSAKIVGRAATGALGAEAQNVISAGVGRGQLPTVKDLSDAAISGGAMNLILPFAQEKITAGADRLNVWRGRGIPAQRYIMNNDLAGRTDGLKEALDKAPFARIQTEGVASGKNTIMFDPSRQIELATSKAISDGKTGDQVGEAAKDATAEHLRTQLLNKALQNSDHTPAGTLTNDQIVTAMAEKRIVIEPAPDVRDFYENGLDVKLGTRFMKLPKGEHTDFSNPSAAKDALKRWASQGREMDYANGITLAPGEHALGFTDKTVTLNRVPPRNPDGTMPNWTGAPVMGEINQKSSNARNFMPNHEAAPALNNNSTAHQVVLEISNNSDNVVTLRPGMPFGSIAFHELGAFPAETERYKMGSVKGQNSLAGHDGVHSSLAYYPVDSAATAPTPTASLGSRMWKSLSLFDDHRSALNGPPMEPVSKPSVNFSLDYSSMTPWEQLRLRPDLQDNYARALQLKLAVANSLTDSDILKAAAPELLVPKGS